MQTKWGPIDNGEGVTHYSWMRISSALWFAVAAFLLLVSLPGVPEQIRILAELLGMSGAEWRWWNYAGVAAGLILMFTWFYSISQRVRRYIGGGERTLDWRILIAYAKGLWLPLFAVAAVAGIVIAIIVALIHYEPSPKMVWSHPTLSMAEQEREKAECRMRASETFRNRLKYWTEYHQYEADCLTTKGFMLERFVG